METAEAQELMTNLRTVMHAMQTRLIKHLPMEGIGVSDLVALRAVLIEGPLTHAQLTAHTGLSKGGLTPVVAKLVAAGFVERRRDELDGRVMWLHATPKAQRQRATIERQFGGFLEATLGDWSEHRRTRLRLALQDFAQALTDVERSNRSAPIERP